MTKVDVLAAMDRLIGNTRTMAGLTGDPRMREHLSEGEQARAAVAELIEAAKEVEQDMHTLDMFTTRLTAALARIGGAA